MTRAKNPSRCGFLSALFVALAMLPLSADYTLNAGRVNAQVDNEWAAIHTMIWPKDTEKICVNVAQNGIAYDHQSTYIRWIYYGTDKYIGFYENTGKSSQEVRYQNKMDVQYNYGGTTSAENIDAMPIRGRTIVRSFSKDQYPGRASEIEVVYEYKNVTNKPIPDFYCGFSVDFSISFNVKYIQGKKLFWFGDKSLNYFAAVMMTLNNVHSAKLKTRSFRGDYNDFSDGMIPDNDLSSSTYFPTIFFSSKEAQLDPDERVYQGFVIAFASTEEELLGSINRLSAGTDVATDVGGLTLMQGAPPAPAVLNTGAVTGGGCLIPVFAQPEIPVLPVFPAPAGRK